MTPPVHYEEDMGLKSILPDEPSHKANQLSLNAFNGTELNFAPKCGHFCFTRKTVCDHIKNNVHLNNVGDYVIFPSKCFHQGYFNSELDMIYVTAQLFARPTISIACDQLTRSHTKDLDLIQSNLNDDTVAAQAMTYCRTGIQPTPLIVLSCARTLMGQLIRIPIIKFLTLSFIQLHC